MKRSEAEVADGPKNLSVQALITLYKHSPKDDASAKGLVRSGKIFSDTTEVADILTGGYNTAAGLAERTIGSAFAPDTTSFDATYNFEYKNVSQYGFWMYLRIRYEKQADGGLEEQFSNWEQWKHNGYDGVGTFQGKEDITKAIMTRAMEWRMKLFIQEKK